MNVANSSYCSSRTNPCKPFGLYDPDASSTYKNLGVEFNATYGDGTNAYGYYATDELGLGDVNVDDMQFGVAESTTITREFSVSICEMYLANCVFTFLRGYHRCSL